MQGVTYYLLARKNSGLLLLHEIQQNKFHLKWIEGKLVNCDQEVSAMWSFSVQNFFDINFFFSGFFIIIKYGTSWDEEGTPYG